MGSNPAKTRAKRARGDQANLPVDLEARLVVPQDQQTGSRVHTLLAHYAAHGLRPDVDTIIADTRALLSDQPIIAKYHVGPARIITATALGVAHLPPVNVPCVGVEVPMDGARADSVWDLSDAGITFSLPAGRLIIEITCSSDLRRLRGVGRSSQITRELMSGVLSGEPFVGVSLLNLSHPPSSLLFTAQLGPDYPVPLMATRFWFGPRLKSVPIPKEES